MNDDKRRHIAVHINELVLPHGSRMPDQASLRKAIEAEVRKRMDAGSSAIEAASARPAKPGAPDVAAAVAQQVTRSMKG